MYVTSKERSIDLEHVLETDAWKSMDMSMKLTVKIAKIIRVQGCDLKIKTKDMTK